ncbi:MAG: N-acetylmuramoyl-L-alanine amidase, family 2 [Marmoricola sp.]|nr:N-acetylmuramoyl-L-alanine amidase, family 2 [Marmoricola sp.]
MRFTRARYITICQQFLVTAVVVTVGASAAGVMNLQIVAPDAKAPGADAQALDLAPAVRVTEGFVATRTVTPKVREVKVAALAPTRKAKIAKPRLAALSKPTAVHGYATVGVTWKSGTRLAEDDISVQVRTRKGGAWSGWTNAAYHDEHGPDAGSTEADRATRPGTDPVVIGDVDQVQMRAETANGKAPSDLELAVIDPGSTTVVKEAAAIDTARIPASDRDATSSAPISTTAGMEGSGSAATHGDGAAVDLDLVAMKTAPKPTIYSRAQWGANEKLRDKSSLHYATVKTGFIHHTVNANDYTAQEVPALLRGIYAYHTQSRGWSDIGYNYLVDRFGRIWEGRYGGVDRAVVGAHTLGYNDYAFAMSAIGNYEIAQPPQAVLDAYAALFAWKLSLYDIKADATHLKVKDRYLNAINGHRDVGQTACPGKYLYAKIPSIRVAAAAIQRAAQDTTDPITKPVVATLKGTPSPTTKPRAASAQNVAKFPVRQSIASTGWPDLVVKRTDGRIQVIPTQGMLGYRTKVVSSGDWSRFSLLTVVGDVTGDGKADLFAKNGSTGGARIFKGDGTGRFNPTGIAPTSAFAGIDKVYAARDFNGGGKNDLLGHDKASGAMLLFKGHGDGTFSKPVKVAKTWPYTSAAAVGDFNGDKQADLAVTTFTRRLYLLPGLKGGTGFGKPVRLGTLPGPVNTLYGWGDLTGNSVPDVMVRVKGSQETYIYAGDGKGKVMPQTYGPLPGLAGLDRSSAAPVAGTSAADVVGRTASGKLVTVLNNGLSNVSAALATNLKVTGATQVLMAGDWDRDGKADVIVRTSKGNQLVLYPGLGNGKFGRGRSLGTGWSGITRLAAVGDVTGDRNPDLMGRTAKGPMTIFPGNGVKAFKAPVLAPTSLRTFNQIGRDAWSPRGATFNSVGGSFVPLAGGDLGSALRAANGSEDPVYDTYVGVGDVNGDGVADLLAREKGTGTIWLLPGKTSGGFAPRTWVANGFAGYQLIG